MKAISLWQPWATLIALKAKQWETRSWETSYRGPLAIHAAKKWTWNQRQLCREPYFKDALDGFGAIKPFPFGCIVAVAELVKIVPTELADIKFISSRGRAFGDYSSGRYAWQLANIRAIEPFKIRGHQKLWNILDELIEGKKNG